MKPFRILFLISLSLLMMSSCAKVFYSPDANILANNHRTIAIVPPTVSIAAARRVEAEALKEHQFTESLNFQKEMYAWLLRRKMQGRITQEILDIETTNARLQSAGYPETIFSPNEMCEILGVDGIITSNFSLSKPMSDGAAVALGLLVGVWGATNEVRVSMGIHDGQNRKHIWNYDHKFSGGVGSSPSRLVNDLMRRASRRMPYIR